MERQFQCPSCGAANLATNPGVLMKVCDYCKTAIYWDKDSALRAGQKSMDLPQSRRFKVGATGKIKGRSFRVLGRLSYGHETGTWNEWFVEMQDGSILWLSEEEGELFLEAPVQLTTPVPPHKELQPGMHIKLNDKQGVIEDIGEARCLGGEGQIPFQVEIGETYGYADGTGTDGSFSFGLEYDRRTGAVTAFIGQALDLKQCQVRPEDHEAPVSRVGKIIRCPSCGKPYEGPREPTTGMVVCNACGAGLELDEAEVRVVGKNKGKEPQFTFQIGQPITMEGTHYEVMGRLFYVEVEDHTEYRSFEYVLYNPEAGYLWLSEEEGHFTISRVSHFRVAVPPIPVTKMKIRVGQETFKVYESGSVTLRWVDGALPWIAAVGETTRYTTLVKPPEYIDQEITGKEVELFRGRYVSREEMLAAIPQGVKLPEPKGVYSCQPYVSPPRLRGMGKIGGAFLLLNMLLLIYSFVADKGTVVLRETMSAPQYSQEHTTQPFAAGRDGAIYRLTGSAPLDNSWLALDFGLVDSEDRVLSEFAGEAAFYHGQDSEGYWTEGSRLFSSYFTIAKTGTYRLVVHGQGGSGQSGPARNEPATINVYSDVTISWYFIIPLILSAFVMFIPIMHRWSFEARRWLPVTKDDGDGDNGNGDDDD